MVECIRCVFLDDWALVVQTVNLGNSSKRIEQDCHKQSRPLRKEASSRIWCSKKDRAHNQSHNDIQDKLRSGCGDIAPYTLICPPDVQLNLHRYANEEWRLGTNMLCLDEVLLFAECCEAFAML